jgi:hypothetical protein
MRPKIAVVTITVVRNSKTTIEIVQQQQCNKN